MTDYTEMTAGEYIEALKKRVDALSKLLADPHPGIPSWVSMLGNEMNDVCEMWQQGKDEAPTHTV